jgi:hypothetical protein
LAKRSRAPSIAQATIFANSYLHGTTSNSGVAGYWTAGDGNGQSTRKLTFSGETTSTIAATVAVAFSNIEAEGTSNSGTAGYILHSNSASSMSKLLFSNDTISSLQDGLMQNSQTCGVSNSGIAGYYAGAFSGSGGGTSIRKITFSNDTFSSTSAGLSSSRSQAGGISNSGTAGYICAGIISGASVGTVQKLTYSGETSSTLGASFSSHRFQGGTAGNKGVAGYYVAGGSTTGGYNWALRTDLNKVNFSNDTISSFGSVTQNAYNTALSNEGTI